MMNTAYEMNDKDMEQVNGGFDCADEYEEECCINHIHPYCGGYIKNALNPLVSPQCTKCGESHYWYRKFFPSARNYVF